jgi:dinuclear metal center YbgI/SA1388 family protein
MKFIELHQHFERWASASFAENYDNVGLIVGEYDTEITGILVNLEVTEEVLEEAIQLGCNLLVTHHPIWFQARKKLNGEDYVSRIIMKAIRNHIGLYAIHTNLDSVISGVNRKIAEILELEIIGFIKKHPTLEVGSGIYGNLKALVSFENFLSTLKEKFQVPCIRYSRAFHKPLIQKIAICGGSGSFLIPEVFNLKVDAFVTADITYHKFFDNEGQFYLIDLGHYESEQYTCEIILDYLKSISNFAVYLSKIKTNPVQYY